MKTGNAGQEIVQGDAGGGNLIDGAGYLINRGREVAILIRITDSRVLLTRFRILSYSISSSVLP